MPSEYEMRTATLRDVRVTNGRSHGSASPRIVGYAAVFDKLSDDLGGFRERIAPGAFTRTLRAGADVRALVDHKASAILGRTKSGTLSLESDSRGLRATIRPPDTTIARDLLESIRRGDVDQMSFAFRTVSDAWETIDSQEVRTLRDVDLFDVSVVTFPAYADTFVGVRSPLKGETMIESAMGERATGKRPSFERHRRALRLKRELGMKPKLDAYETRFITDTLARLEIRRNGELIDPVRAQILKNRQTLLRESR